MKNNLRTVICLLMSFIFLFSGVVVFAENTADTGIWEKRAYVDEFDMPTDEYYVSNAEPIVGKFSNSATTDSELHVYLYINKGQMSIKLIEYGSHVVKNAYSTPLKYHISLMNSDGELYNFDGYMQSGSDRINISTYECIDPNFTNTLEDVIINTFCTPGTIRFVITEENSPATKYSFVLNDASGFDNFIPFSKVGYFNGYELAPVLRAGKWGFINSTGKLIIPCIYDYADEFSDGLAVVKDNGKYGYIDLKGELVIPCKYNECGKYSNGLALVRQDAKFGFMDKNENIVIPCQFEMADSFLNGLAAVKIDGKWGLIDTSGNYVIPAIYDNISSFAQGLYAVKLNGKYGIVNSNGEIVIPCELEYDYLGKLSEGYAPVYIKTGESQFGSYKWGFIDENGLEVYPCKMDYQYVGKFCNGLARIQEKDDFNYGYIDYSCNEIISCQYQYAEDFVDGIAKVRIESPNNSKVLTYNGQIIKKAEYRYGFIDYNGKQVIPCKYLDAVYDEGIFVLLDEEGISIIPREEIQPQYETELAAREQKLEEMRKEKISYIYTGPEIIERVQTTLNKLGYDCGTPDGIAGKGTTGAITQYQTDKGLNITGTITHELLISLGLIES